MRLAMATLLAVFTFSLVAVGQDQQDTPKKEIEKFQGTWVITSWVRDGKADKSHEGGKVTFKGRNFERTSAKETVKGTIKPNPKTKPKELETTLTEGPDKGKTLAGIYEFEGETLKICYAGPDKDRPKDFTSKPESGHFLLVFKRDKAEVAKREEPAKPPMPATPPPPPPVTIADKNLEAAIRAVLQEPKAPLTETNLLNVYVLEAASKGIANLQGLDKCKNLALLKLTNNQVADLSPLKELVNLQSLDLANNKITDIGPLARLTKLQYLELSNNQVQNVTPLSKLTALSALYLSNNKVADIKPLGELTKLSSLSLGKNQVKDISALATVNRLTTLDLNDNQIEDIRPLMKQTELSLLMLERNKISDLSPLTQMAKADAAGAKRFAPYLRLYLKGNPSPLDELKKIGVRVDN